MPIVSPEAFLDVLNGDRPMALEHDRRSNRF